MYNFDTNIKKLNKTDGVMCFLKLLIIFKIAGKERWGAKLKTTTNQKYKKKCLKTKPVLFCFYSINFNLKYFANLILILKLKYMVLYVISVISLACLTASYLE